MDKLRRSFRSSFRRRKEPISEASKPHLWQTDEMDVRAGTCFFHVKVSRKKKDRKKERKKKKKSRPRHRN